MRAAGASCAGVREEPAFDEHQLELLLRETRGARLSTEAVEPATREESGEPGWSQRDELRQFRDVLEEATTRWLEGAPGTEGIESWPAFRSRVRAALTPILEQKGRGRKVAVITSAGVIGVILQTALGCSDAHAMALSRRLRNASLSEFVFSGGRFTLDCFNAMPHLPDRRLWTYL
jgi:broad specificity phosphatase PhoE